MACGYDTVLLKRQPTQRVVVDFLGLEDQISHEFHNKCQRQGLPSPVAIEPSEPGIQLNDVEIEIRQQLPARYSVCLFGWSRIVCG